MALEWYVVDIQASSVVSDDLVTQRVGRTAPARAHRLVSTQAIQVVPMKIGTSKPYTVARSCVHEFLHPTKSAKTRLSGRILRCKSSA